MLPLIYHAKFCLMQKVMLSLIRDDEKIKTSEILLMNLEGSVHRYFKQTH